MRFKHWLMAATAIAGAATAFNAAAQTAPVAPAARSNTIEELVVTAEKREQSLQDVPVAVTAFSDERRDLVGINSVQDLTNFTPGLSYTTNNDRASLRGIGRFTNNRSSEGGVAMYSDGFYTSSVTSFAQSSLFIDRTEVLRGPQGTLYGRNAIGGALNIISKHPTDDPYAEVRAGFGNYDNQFYEAAVSGPIYGSIRGRLAGSFSHQGEGYFTNLSGGPSEGGRGDQWDVEGQLDGKLGDGDRLEWWVKYVRAKWDNIGRGPGGRTTAVIGQRENGQLFTGGSPGLTPNPGFGYADPLPGNVCTLCFSTDDPNYITLDNEEYVGQVVLHADTFDVKYIAGRHWYDYRLQTDVDGTARSAPFTVTRTTPRVVTPTASNPNGYGSYLPVNGTVIYPRQNNQYMEEVWWFSNELNFSSTTPGPVQWLFGLYQYKEESNYAQVDARYPDDPRFEHPILPTGAPAAPNPLRQYAYGRSDNVSESYASFGQIDWNVTNVWKLTAGLRYTLDRKQSFESVRLLCFASPNCPTGPAGSYVVDLTNYVSAPGPQTDPSVVGPVYTDPTTGLRHRLLQQEWDAWSGTLGVEWKPDRDTLGYAKYTRGYKAGGFNGGSTTLPEHVTTGKELIDAYEVGLKKTFSGSFQANASAFYYDYMDIQVPLTSIDPVLQTNRTDFLNVPKARIIGFELETIWQPIDDLQILANYSYLNAEIKEGCCYQDSDDPQAIQPGANPVGLPTKSGARGQNLAGQKLPSSTPNRVTVNVNYTWRLNPGDLSASVSYVWRDDTYYSIFNRYYNMGKAYDQVDARAVFTDINDHYTVIGYVKNVFDVRGTSGVSGSRLNTPLLPTTGYINQTLSYVPPRTYGIELRYRF